MAQENKDDGDGDKLIPADDAIDINDQVFPAMQQALDKKAAMSIKSLGDMYVEFFTKMLDGWYDKNIKP